MMIISQANSPQAGIEVMAAQLFKAFTSKRPDLCASCYEQYGIVNYNENENLIGQTEIKRYWERLVSAGITAVERTIPRVTFHKPYMFTLCSTWVLSDGSEMQLSDTWVRQEDATFKLLMQNIKRCAAVNHHNVA